MDIASHIIGILFDMRLIALAKYFVREHVTVSLPSHSLKRAEAVTDFGVKSSKGVTPCQQIIEKTGECFGIVVNCHNQHTGWGSASCDRVIHDPVDWIITGPHVMAHIDDQTVKLACDILLHTQFQFIFHSSLPLREFVFEPIVVSGMSTLHSELARARADASANPFPLSCFAGQRTFTIWLHYPGPVIAVAILPGRVAEHPLIRCLPIVITMSASSRGRRTRGERSVEYPPEEAISLGQSLALGLVHFILGHLRISRSELSNSFSRTFCGHLPTLQKGTSFGYARAHKRAEAIDRSQARAWPPLLLWLSGLFAVGISYSTSNVDERFCRSHPNYTKSRIVSTFVRRLLHLGLFKIRVENDQLPLQP